MVEAVSHQERVSNQRPSSASSGHITVDTDVSEGLVHGNGHTEELLIFLYFVIHQWFGGAKFAVDDDIIMIRYKVLCWNTANKWKYSPFHTPYVMLW